MTDEDRYFGYGSTTWDAMVDAGYRYLADLAARGTDTDYTSLCRELHSKTGTDIAPHDFALAHVLGDIGTRSHDEHGVVLTVLVHYKDGVEPGPGFFGLCQELGLLPGELSEPTRDSPSTSNRLGPSTTPTHPSDARRAEGYRRRRPRPTRTSRSGPSRATSDGERDTPGA